MEGFFKKFGAVYRFICSLILALMVLIVFVNAVMRYFMHSGFVATEEVLRYLFIYLSFLGIVEVAYQRGHISVSILTDALKGRARTFIYIIGYILSVYAICVLIDGSIEYFKESDTSIGQVTGLPFQFIIASLIFAAFGLLVFVLRDLILAVKSFAMQKEFPPRYVDEDVKAILNQEQRGDHK